MKQYRILVVLAAIAFLITNGGYAQTTGAPQPESKSALQEAIKTPDIATELEGPDGATIQLLPDGGWRIFGKGEGTYDINDPDEIRQASKDAQLRAKGNIAKFLSERIKNTEEMVNLATKHKLSSDDGSGKPTVQVTKTDIQARMEKISSQADAILKGVVVLATQKTPRANGGVIAVKVGVSSRTVALATSVADQIEGRSNVSGGTGNVVGMGGASGGANKPEMKKATSDF
jgi:hypothetical protein